MKLKFERQFHGKILLKFFLVAELEKFQVSLSL